MGVRGWLITVWLWFACGAYLAIEGQAVAEGPGGAGAVTKDVGPSQEPPLRQQELQGQDEPTPKQLRQSEIINRMRELKMEIEKKSQQRGQFDPAPKVDPVMPQRREPSIEDAGEVRPESPTCQNEQLGRAFLDCLDRIAPKR